MEELDSFPKVNGVIRDASLIDWINCSVCDSNLTRQWLVKWGGRYDVCKVCGYYFLKNPFKKEILQDLYSSSISDEIDRKVNQNEFNVKYWTLVYVKYLEILFSLNKARISPRLLDIGCGVGHFLATSIKGGKFDSYGLDVYDQMLEKLKGKVDSSRLFRVDDVLDFKPNKQFDVITLWGVLEHLRNAKALFKKMNYWMPLGGMICALIPNINSRALKILGATVPTLNPRAHINFFTKNSIGLVAEGSGFQLLDIFYELPIIDLMWPFVDQDDPQLIDDIMDSKEAYYQILIFKKVGNLPVAS